MSKKLLAPGELVIRRPNAEVTKLIAWSSCMGSIDDDVGLIDSEELMVIVEVKKTSKAELSNPRSPLTHEWRKGAYKVISSSGINGWIGAGWVIPVNNLVS